MSDVLHLDKEFDRYERARRRHHHLLLHRRHHRDRRRPGRRRRRQLAGAPPVPARGAADRHRHPGDRRQTPAHRRGQALAARANAVRAEQRTATVRLWDVHCPARPQRQPAAHVPRTAATTPPPRTAHTSTTPPATSCGPTPRTTTSTRVRRRRTVRFGQRRPARPGRPADRGLAPQPPSYGRGHTGGNRDPAADPHLGTGEAVGDHEHHGPRRRDPQHDALPRHRREHRTPGRATVGAQPDRRRPRTSGSCSRPSATTKPR